MRKPKTLIEKFNTLLVEANDTERAEMERAFYWCKVFAGKRPALPTISGLGNGEPKVQSRSVQRRIATIKGEKAPDFSKPSESEQMQQAADQR